MSFQAYLDNIEEKTGKTPNEFIAEAKKKKLTTSKEIIAWLKNDYGLGLGHARAIDHVIRHGAEFTVRQTTGSHRDASGTLDLDGKAARAKFKSTQPKTDFPPTIGNPARQALRVAGFTKLKQLTQVSEAELGKLHGMGPKAIRILRETLESHGMSFAGISRVDAFMQKLDHPLKAEIEALRKIIPSASPEITEQIKWNAPSYSYRGAYLVTFNLRERKRIHLVFHNPMIAKIKSPLLEGDYVDRRMVYFSNRQDIRLKKAELVRVLKQLIKLNSGT